MKSKEARELVRRIRSSLRDCRHWLLDLHERDGYRALGYATWREFVELEFGASVRHCYRLLQAAAIEKEVTNGHTGKTGRQLPEAHCRELAALPTAELRREIYAEATADGDTSAKDLRELVSQHMAEAKRQTAARATTPTARSTGAELHAQPAGDRPGPGYWRVLPTGRIVTVAPGGDFAGRIVTVRAGDLLHFERD